MSEIRLYVEGGGEREESRALVRQGFSRFLTALVTLARSKRIRWSITVCGGRAEAFDKFRIARQFHPQAVCLLLVDAEGPVQRPGKPWSYLRRQDRWRKPPWASDDHCHLMVQAMEAWLIADPDSLRRYYGQRFNASALPSPANIEQVEPARLVSALRAATRQTSKGEYQKVQHGAELLG